MDRIATLPKAELHVHLEGTLEPETVFRLAERNSVRLPYADVDELRARYDFRDLVSFLDLYYECMTALRTREDFRDLTRAYLERAADDGVRHVEAFFDPQVHLANGADADGVLDGILGAFSDARREHGITGGVILCLLRDRPVAEAAATLERYAPRAGDLLGVGLDSAEAGFPPGPFAGVFARAAALGLHRVAHAGEEGPAAYVTEALDALGVERVDHGVHCLEDARLVARLREARIPLTVCPLSTLALGGVDSLDEHAFPRLVDEGLVVALASDDPAYFGGYVADVYRRTAATFGLDEAALADLATASIDASFAPEERKEELRREIDSWRGDATGA